MPRTRRSVIVEAVIGAAVLALVGVALQLWGADAGFAYGLALAQLVLGIPVRLYRLRRRATPPRPHQEDDLVRWRRGF